MIAGATRIPPRYRGLGFAFAALLCVCHGAAQPPAGVYHGAALPPAVAYYGDAQPPAVAYYGAAQPPAVASPIISAPALVAIVIDDLGNDLAQGQRTLALPGPLTCAFLPFTPYAERLARLAHAQGKEVMVHLPMEAEAPLPLGPGGLYLAMDERLFKRTLAFDLAAVPYAVGVNNHMGSLLTRQHRQMVWLMQILEEFGLYFVDSRTTRHTIAAMQARLAGIPCRERDVFLDTVANDLAYVRSQLRQLEQVAERQGLALGIGHPYPATLRALRERLPEWPARGLQLVPVSTLIYRQQGEPPWPVSLSPSPRVAKN